MNPPNRIKSILTTSQLESSITGLPTFDLADLKLDNDLIFSIPTNLRLGHLAERIVAALIKLSTNYHLLYENVQLIENKKTIGEIDFIIQEEKTKQVIHLELAYKFYLFDPTISTEPINNWIGPNRNDSLSEKLEKVKRHQFPLLYHEIAKSTFANLDFDKVEQALCLLVSLFVPYEYKGRFDSGYKKAIKGYYLNFEKFTHLNDPGKRYYLPSKKEWGMEPSENEIWTDFNGIKKDIEDRLVIQKAPLCWQKHNGTFLSFFIVWW